MPANSRGIKKGTRRVPFCFAATAYAALSHIEVSKALTGQITADACCDTLIAAIKEVQKG